MQNFLDYVHHFQWQNVAFKLSWPASSCFSNLIPCAYRETYRREGWGIGDTKSLADSVFFFYLNFLFHWLLCLQWEISTQRCGKGVTSWAGWAFHAVKLIPTNLTDRLVRSFRHVVSCSRATMVPRPSRVLQFFFFWENSEITFSKRI